jgi:hypothetical protein
MGLDPLMDPPSLAVHREVVVEDVDDAVGRLDDVARVR